MVEVFIDGRPSVSRVDAEAESSIAIRVFGKYAQVEDCFQGFFHFRIKRLRVVLIEGFVRWPDGMFFVFHVARQSERVIHVLRAAFLGEVIVIECHECAECGERPGFIVALGVEFEPLFLTLRCGGDCPVIIKRNRLEHCFFVMRFFIKISVIRTLCYFSCDLALV